MNKLKLASMDASDMVDVIHYFFEEDMYYSTPEQAESRSKGRTQIYETMYGRPYKWGSPAAVEGVRGNIAAPESYGSIDATNEDIRPFDPLREAVKPYVAPTPVNANSASPFGSALDAPLG